jgi:calmodulin
MSDEEIIGCFRLLDTEGKGFVKADDLRRMLTTMGEKMSDREVDQLLADAGGGSKVEYEKFVKKINKAAAGGA